jgi:hypothetical protein
MLRNAMELGEQHREFGRPRHAGDRSSATFSERLQKLIMVALCEARYAVTKRQELNLTVKRFYYGKDS